MSRPPDRNPGIAIGSGHTCDTPSGLPCQACAGAVEEVKPAPINVDGRQIGPGVFGIGDAKWHAESKQWRCLADFHGTLAVVEVKVRA